MSDLAPDAKAAAPYATAGAGPADQRVAANNLPCCPHLGSFLLGDDPRIFPLCPVTPDGGFLLAHEGNITRRGG